MPLEVLVSGCDEKSSSPLYLSIYDYNVIKEKIDSENRYRITKKILSAYYGERKVHVNELEDLKQEVSVIKDFFHTAMPDTTMLFLNEFVNRITLALSCGKALVLTESGLPVF